MSYYNGKPYLVVFQPSRVMLREKHSQKVVRKCYPSFREYNALIGFCLNSDAEYFLKNLVEASGFIDDDFKEVVEFKVNWPAGGEEAVEIGQRAIENGILREHQREAVINNRHYEVELR